MSKKRSNGKLGRHAYESALNALNMMGVSITCNALYKRVERESKRIAPTEVIVEVSSTNISSITRAANSGQNPSPTYSHATSTSSIISSLSLAQTNPSCSRHQGGHLKESTNEKKQLKIGNYNAFLKAICDDYANKIVAMSSQNRQVYNKFLDNLIVNSLIDGTRLQKTVSEFQSTRQVGNDLFKPGEIGKGW